MPGHSVLNEYKLLILYLIHQKSKKLTISN